MRVLPFVGVLVLAGCQNVPSTLGTRAPDPAASVDTSIAVVDLDARVAETLDAYIAVSNRIAEHHGEGAAAMDAWTTAEWAVDERASFAALAALPETDVPPRIELGRWEVADARGRTVLVDAVVHACFTIGSDTTLVSIRLVPRSGSLLVDEVYPWEDATWCLEPSAS